MGHMLLLLVAAVRLVTSQSDGVEYETNTDFVQILEVIGTSANKTLTEVVEVNTDNEVEVFRVQGYNNDDIEAVLDFSKGTIGIYMQKEESCFLIGGIDKIIPPPDEIRDILQRNVNLDNVYTVLKYVKASEYPIKDMSLVPDQTLESCGTKPFYWLERDTSKTSSTKTRRKRSSNKERMCVNCVGVGDFRLQFDPTPRTINVNIINNFNDNKVYINNPGKELSKPVCPSGFTLHQSISSCYMYVSTPADWTNAQAYCRGLNGHLVVADTAAKQAVILNGRFGNIWAAGQRRGGPGPTTTRFVWKPNTDIGRGTYSMIYTNWGPGEPTNSGGVESCLVIRPAGEGWNDFICSATCPYVCEIEI